MIPVPTCPPARLVIYSGLAHAGTRLPGFCALGARASSRQGSLSQPTGISPSAQRSSKLDKLAPCWLPESKMERQTGVLSCRHTQCHQMSPNVLPSPFQVHCLLQLTVLSVSMDAVGITDGLVYQSFCYRTPSDKVLREEIRGHAICVASISSVYLIEQFHISSVK